MRVGGEEGGRGEKHHRTARRIAHHFEDPDEVMQNEEEALNDTVASHVTRDYCTVVPVDSLLQ